MRAPLLVASSLSLAAAASLAPVFVPGVTGWAGTLVCGSFTIMLMHLRDLHVEEDVRGEVTREATRARLETARALPEVRQELVRVVDHASSPWRLAAPPSPVVEAPELLKGDDVEFDEYAWDMGLVTYKGVVDRVGSNGYVKVRCGPEDTFLVPRGDVRFVGRRA